VRACVHGDAHALWHFGTVSIDRPLHDEMDIQKMCAARRETSARLVDAHSASRALATRAFIVDLRA